MLKYFKQNSGLASVHLIFEGSNLENEDTLGAAHLLEHLVSHNTKKYEDLFDLYGIESNASTGPTYTQYYIKGLDEHVKKFAQKFYDSIVKKSLRVSEQEFNEEKRIIIQEWYDDVTDVESNLLNRFYLKFYKSPRTVGSLKSLENLTFKTFKEMYEKYYSKPLFCLIEQSSNWKIKDSIEYKEDYDSIFEFSVTSEKKVFPNPFNQNPTLLIVIKNEPPK